VLVSDLLYAAADPRISLRRRPGMRPAIGEASRSGAGTCFGLGLALGFLLWPVSRISIASDRPIRAAEAGTSYLLPNLIEYRRLAASFRATSAPGTGRCGRSFRHGPYTIPALADLKGPLPQPPVEIIR